jgi:hypothetical protein
LFVTPMTAVVAQGHSMTIDRGWHDIAHFCLDWLTAQNL